MEVDLVQNDAVRARLSVLDAPHSGAQMVKIVPDRVDLCGGLVEAEKEQGGGEDRLR